ncbi:MAG: PAS domain-containing protein [Sporocytophaga sp.]|uniref:chemotaxis protein CheB n=1 Tax=Sporocytophaga sp. TaxID=2231183 RepID=UPI001B18D3DA|nr:chemotaxis protein CheB [Sporocytophaga sp.]MBO9703878.1 PAS domain-containing protein [Sporocytophaga sp.]
MKPLPIHEESNNSFPIIGIGASAGGLEAIMEFFDNLRQEVNAAFVIIQHLSPDYKSMMPQLLLKHTKMQIHEAQEDIIIEAGCIYVITPSRNITLSNNRLKLHQKKAGKTPNMAIDIFFKSLADERGPNAIGVVLSGTGTDGTKGLEEIRSAGGLAVVQDPKSAKFDGMPKNAIDTGNADMILAVNQMPEEILNFLQDTPGNTIPGRLSDEEETIIHEILNLINKRGGNDFTSYKPSTISRRIAKRMTLNNFRRLIDYKDFLHTNKDELDILAQDFLIGVTKFFRDKDSFTILEKEVIPALFDTNEKEIKIWVAACSTGEEAYSIAILAHEYILKHGLTHQVKIFATDINKTALETASKGIYPTSIEKDISESRLKTWFDKSGDNYRINGHLRKMIVFAQHDLTRNAPYSKIDLISCRNLLIYLNHGLQKNILSKFYFSIKPNRYLFLGTSENIGDLNHEFNELHKKYRIYQKTSNKRKLPTESYGAFGGFTLNNPTLFKFPEASHKPFAFPSAPAPNLTDLLLTHSGFSAVCINENYELTQASGDYEKYIQFKPKHLELNILKIVSEELSIVLGSAIRKAIKHNETITLDRIKLQEENSKRNIQIIISPTTEKKTEKKIYWIFFKELPVIESLKNENTIDLSEQKFITSERIMELEDELIETRENLQTAVEELETSNEEMQSSNEELVSANEELQSTNEELQSLNEELHSVNAEFQIKIKELVELNDDLNNFFKSSDISQIFINRELVIRKFTPISAKQINLIESDIGRPIAHISNNINHPRLIEDIKYVINTQSVLQKEIQSYNNMWYQMKIMPYTKQDQTVDGAIITFVDITYLKSLNNLISGVNNSSLNGIMALEPVKDRNGNITDMCFVLTNSTLEKIFRKKPEALNGKLLKSEFSDIITSELFEKLVMAYETDDSLHTEQYSERQHKWFELSAIKTGETLVITIGDITEKREAELRIREAYEELKKTQQNLQLLNDHLEDRVEKRTRDLTISQERYKALSLATNDAIYDWDFSSNTVWWNEGFKNMFGYETTGESQGIESRFEKIHPEDKQKIIESIQNSVTQGKTQWQEEYRFEKADGSYSNVLDRAYILHFEDGMPYRVIGSIVDLTSLKKTQLELEKTNKNLVRINADLDNFIYTASHDLKAPILNIEGLIQTIKLEVLPNNEDEDFKSLLEMVDISIAKFKETIRDLTEIAKVQKEIIIDQEVIDLKETIEETRLSILDSFIQNNVTLEYNLQVPFILFSRKNLRSIFYNFISNGIKYRHPDRDPHLNITTETVGDFIIFTFSDNGLGIEEDKLDQMFGMFKRFHAHVDGTGIGLYIVKKIVENAGGKISVESTLNEGTTFRIFLKANSIQQLSNDLTNSKKFINGK